MFGRPGDRFLSTGAVTLCICGMACACAWMGEPAEDVGANGARVFVENHSFADVNVFVERDGRSFRLGYVRSKQTTPFLIPHRILGGALDYRLVADPVGSLDRITSPRIEVRRDVITYWMLEPSGWLSSVVIR